MSTELAVWKDDQAKEVQIRRMQAFREVMRYQDHTDNEIMAFVEFCRAQQLNMYTGDVYLIKPGRGYPEYRVIDVSVFIKRAEQSPKFRGLRTGDIVLVDGKPVRRVGQFRLESEALVGGWAEVRRSERDHDIEHSVLLSEVMSRTKDGKPTKIWRENPGLMVEKSALKGVLKVSFPGIFREIGEADEKSQITVIEHDRHDRGRRHRGDTERRHGTRGAERSPTHSRRLTGRPQSDAPAQVRVETPQQQDDGPVHTEASEAAHEQTQQRTETAEEKEARLRELWGENEPAEGQDKTKAMQLLEQLQASTEPIPVSAFNDLITELEINPRGSSG